MPDFETPRGFQDAWTPPVRVRAVITPPSFPSSGGGIAGAGADKARLARIAKKAPEVMVKITGRTKGAAHMRAHLEYISRNGKIELECADGERLAGRRNVHDLSDDWSMDEQLARGRRNSSLSISIILSMPPGTDALVVKDAARSFARSQFEGRYDYAMALHTDGKHPHVHLTVRTTGHDGQKLNPRKADLEQWRQQFAERLRARGIEAEATPRRARGQVRKAERTPVRKARERYETGKGRMPRVTEAAYRDVERDLTGSGRGQGAAAARPWENRIVARQTYVRQAYIQGAAALAKSAEPADRQLARDVQQFVATMPPAMLQRHAIERELRSAIDAQRTPARDQARAEPRAQSIEPERAPEPQPPPRPRDRDRDRGR